MRTLDDLDAAGIGHAGTYRTRAESLEPQIIDVRGIRVGHVAGRSPQRGAAWEEGWSVDVDASDRTPMLEAAARARAAGAEVVVASLLCCLEYDNDPTPSQEEAVGFSWRHRTSTSSSATTPTSSSRSCRSTASGRRSGSATTRRTLHPRLSDRGLRPGPSPSPAVRTGSSPSDGGGRAAAEVGAAAVTVAAGRSATAARTEVLGRLGAVGDRLTVVPN